MGASLMSGNNDKCVERTMRLSSKLQFEVKEMIESLLTLTTPEAALNCNFFQVLSQSLRKYYNLIRIPNGKHIWIWLKTGLATVRSKLTP